ncbi:LuxR C-terminal-related transcriptional regulator [Govanella unica]|uniref:Response regulator transcription factor n=1 Tax=Govanella unica TaxID=2975056 RepID=A0A9X3TYT4_9PROT|nr:response regulator transcription factor [Govania unica]MDA5194293.1 response regulator transcription factor [Govania unica]
MRVLIADDHSLFRQGCKLLLQEIDTNVEITESGDFEEAQAALAGKDIFDLILLDLRMPGLGEIEGVRRIRQLAPASPLVVLSALDDPYYAQKTMECGAAGFIPKSSNPSVIANALKLILAGGSYVPPSLMNRPSTGPKSDKSRRPSEDLYEAVEKVLTPRQMDVMRLLAKGESNKGIADALGLSEGTVKVHVAAILKALNAANRTQAVLIASGMDSE